MSSESLRTKASPSADGHRQQLFFVALLSLEQISSLIVSRSQCGFALSPDCRRLGGVVLVSAPLARRVEEGNLANCGMGTSGLSLVGADMSRPRALKAAPQAKASSLQMYLKPKLE